MIKNNKIKLFQLIMLSMSAIISLKSLPIFAETGSHLFFFLIIAMICFFIPLAMTMAELSSTWPSDGGCYTWIKNAYGNSYAFIVMWAYWMESIIWFPTMLTFIIAMLAHAISPIMPNLENNIIFHIIGIIIIFWVLTYINLSGIKISALFSTIGVIIGTIIPIILIITLGIIWIIKNENINIILNTHTLIPNLNLNNFVFFSGILLGISGIELISFHTTSIDHPQKNIPKIVIILAIIVFIIYLLGSLSIAIVVPNEEICLASGIIQALKIFFIKNNMTAIIPFLGFLLFLGSISGMNAWIIGPAKGIFVTTKDGFLPNFLSKVNKNNVPANLLIIQAIIGSTLSITFSIFIKNLNGLIWIFICLSFQFSSILYIMIFMSVIKLRQKYPEIKRPYKMPFIKIIPSIGITICIFTFFTAYLQPISINITNNFLYIILLILSFTILLLPSIFLINIKKFK